MFVVSDALGRRGLGWPWGQGPKQMEGTGPGGGKVVSREWTGDSEPRVSGAEVRLSAVGGPTSLGPGCAVGCLAGPWFSLMLGSPG